MDHANNRSVYFFGIDEVRKLTLMATRDSLETYYQDGSIHCHRARSKRSAAHTANRKPRNVWASGRVQRYRTAGPR
jgi:hypothetical protein